MLPPQSLFVSPKYHGTRFCWDFSFDFCSFGLAVPFPEKGGGEGGGWVSCSLLSRTATLSYSVPKSPAPKIPPLPLALASIHMASRQRSPHPSGRGFSHRSPAGGGGGSGSPGGQSARSARAAPRGPARRGAALSCLPPLSSPGRLDHSGGCPRCSAAPGSRCVWGIAVPSITGGLRHRRKPELHQQAQRCPARIVQADSGKAVSHGFRQHNRAFLSCPGSGGYFWFTWASPTHAALNPLR